MDGTEGLPLLASSPAKGWTPGGPLPQTLLGRLRAELSLPFFSLQDETGNTLDVRATFAPRPKWLTASIRVAILLWCLQILHLDLFIVKAQYYYAFISQWSHSMTIVFYFVSSYVAIFDSATIQKGAPSRSVCFLWGWFSMTMCFQMLVTIFFWLNYQVFLNMPEITRVSSVMKHGGFLSMLFWDGIYHSRIPVRVKHYVFPWFGIVCYTIWLMVNNLHPNLTNPLFKGADPAHDDDCIYPNLSLTRHFGYSVFILGFSQVLGIPAFFFVLWCMSAWSWGRGGFGWSHRRYVAKSQASV